MGVRGWGRSGRFHPRVPTPLDVPIFIGLGSHSGRRLRSTLGGDLRNRRRAMTEQFHYSRKAHTGAEHFSCVRVSKLKEFRGSHWPSEDDIDCNDSTAPVK